jgi:hypothetical protein
MFLKDKQTGTLVEIVDPNLLFDPNEKEVAGRVQEGQEEQDTSSFAKTGLIFPSGESLPLCWLDENYRNSTGSPQ